MTDLKQFRTGIRAALVSLEDAMRSEDIDEAQAYAIQGANAILLSSRPRPVAIQRSYCANPVCGRLITENDPIFAGHCSTMCRESFNNRVLMAVRAKYARGAAQ